MDKIIKTSKTIRAILKVLFWVVAVVSVVILAAILVVLFMKGFVKGGTALDDGFFYHTWELFTAFKSGVFFATAYTVVFYDICKCCTIWNIVLLHH